jgi:TonB family protein
VKYAIEKKLTELGAAYALELAQNPGLRGTLQLEFTIGTDGKATDFATDKNTVNATLEQAVIDILKEVQFAKPAQAVRVTVPFTFKL